MRNPNTQSDHCGPAAGPTILLVEDDASVHAALSDVLVAEGFRVLHAFDAVDAFERFFRHCGIDLVLLDLNLPDRAGWDVFEPLTRRRPDLPVIVITARPNQFAVASAAGVAALMEKPLDLPLLLTTIREVLNEPQEIRLARLMDGRPLTRHLKWNN